MTGLLDPTLKHTDEFRLRQQNVLSGICMFKVSKAKKKKKKKLETCQIYSKLITKTLEQHLVLLLLSLNIFHTFEKINIGWV